MIFVTVLWAPTTPLYNKRHFKAFQKKVASLVVLQEICRKGGEKVEKMWRKSPRITLGNFPDFFSSRARWAISNLRRD